MWPSLIAAITSAMKDRAERKQRMRQAQDDALATGPSWRYRRRLIHGAYIIGVLMIIAGGATVFLQSQIGVELIIGGVALLSIIITAYTTSATYEDVRLWNQDTRIRFGQEEIKDDYGPGADG
jgi:cytochrome c-type biogenesis protein CcmH/NrfG